MIRDLVLYLLRSIVFSRKLSPIISLIFIIGKVATRTKAISSFYVLILGNLRALEMLLLMTWLFQLMSVTRLHSPIRKANGIRMSSVELRLNEST